MMTHSNKHFYLWNILANGLVERLCMQTQITGNIIWVGPSAHILQAIIKQKSLSVELEIIEDIELLSNHSADIILINAMLAWTADIEAALQTIAKALNENGVMLFSALGPNTVHDIQQQAITMQWQPKNNALIDMHHWGDMLLKAHYKDPVMDRQDIDIEFDAVHDWFKDWHHFGFKIYSTNHFSGLITPKKWQTFCEKIQAGQPRWSAAIELIFGMAYKPVVKAQQLNKDGSISVSLDALKASLKST